MFDYKKILGSENFEGMHIEVTQADKTVSLVGNEKGLLYLASRIINYVKENNPNTDFNDMKFDRGVDLTDKSLSLSVLLAEKEDIPTTPSEENIKKSENFREAVKKRNYK